MKLVSLSIQEFVEKLAEGTPAPAGGSAGALCGALGAALCSMVSDLTIGRESLKPAWEEMKSVGEEARALAGRYLDLVDDDAASYEKVIAARRLPRKTEVEKNTRLAALEKAFMAATLVPLEGLRAAERLMRVARSAVERGNPNTVSDAGAALRFARAAADVAVANVRVNLLSIGDNTFVGECRREMSEIMRSIDLLYAEAVKYLDLQLG